ncbi:MULTISPECIES: hypothetical protein [unclassified Micromonospora]|uniref:hypothetical protein n=1 Tax=unclassified Micromonospora TaxID=2617518 RepID=UPI0033294470
MADDLQAGLAKRRRWFFETQLRRLNLGTFRDLVRETADPDEKQLLDLISEPFVTPAIPRLQVGSSKSPLGDVYLDSRQPVWTFDEQARRGAFATFIGPRCDWLEFKEPRRLAEVLAGYAAQFETDRFTSVLEKSPIGLFRRKAATADNDPNTPWDERVLTDQKGPAICRAMIAAAKPWLLPELYHPVHSDSTEMSRWLENLERLVADFERELINSTGGFGWSKLPFDRLAPDAYRDWVEHFLTESLKNDPKVKVQFLAQNPKEKGGLTYSYSISVETNGYPLRDADAYPFSHKVKYWKRVIDSTVKEVYVNKENSDMGLCLLIRMLYLFGTVSQDVTTVDKLRWRTRAAPGPEFEEFFANRAADEYFKKHPDDITRLSDARTKLRKILEASAALPHTAAVTFSPVVEEVLRQAIHSYKFWLDEPLHANRNTKLQQARTDLGFGDIAMGEMEYWSENHYIMFASSEYLAGQLWPGDEFQPGKEFLDAGSKTGVRTGAERRERGRARVLRWLNHRLMFGWTEFNSSGYYREHLWALLNLVDFALDDEVRKKATLVTDLLMFDVARFQHKGAMGAVGGRSQFKSKCSGWDNALGDVVEMAFGTRGLFTDGDSLVGASFATSTYKVPDVLLEIGVNPPKTGFVDRSRVSITFDEAPKYGILQSQESDEIDSLRKGYAPKLAKHFPFIGDVNDKIAKCHSGYGQFEDSIVFWWGTSALFNKQMAVGSLDCIEAFGLNENKAFKTLALIMGVLTSVKEVTDTVVGAAIGAAVGGGVGAVAGTVIGFLTRDNVEDIADDVSVLLEGSTRTRANIYTYSNGDIMLSSIQNFRAGQLNYQSNVNQATVNSALNVFTTAGYAGIDISFLVAAGVGAVVGGTVGGIPGAIVGTAGAVAGNEFGLEGENLFGDETDGPAWWTGYWALPMVVQDRGASIIAYNFHDIQSLLAETGSHAWFPKYGFERTDEVRCSAYDDDNLFLQDVFDIGPKGFWLFGKVTHQVEGVAVADRPEAYIGLFSNRRPDWLSREEHADVYDRVFEDASEKPIEELEDKIDDTENPDEKRKLEHDKVKLERVWDEPLPKDYFADRDWYVNGKNVWIIQVGSKAEFGDYETFKSSVSRAKVTLDDAGDLECTYHMPLPDGTSTALSLKYEDGGEFGLGGSPLATNLYPRFENPYLRGRRVEWGQRAYVIEYNGKTLLHDFHDFTDPVRTEDFTVTDADRDTVRALVMFAHTGNEEMEELTIGTATVRIGCATVADNEIVAVGPAAENSAHDAEWIFFDIPTRLSPDCTIELAHRAIDDGDDEAEWVMSFSLKALMGDHTLRDCALSFNAAQFDEDRRAAGPLPFAVGTDRWRPWESVPDSRMWEIIVLAQLPSPDRFYYDHADLLVAAPRLQMQHRGLEPCLEKPVRWAAIPTPPGGPEFTPGCSVRAFSRFPGDLVAVVLESGHLFRSSPDSTGRWDAWTRDEPLLPGSPPQPVPLASPGTVYVGPSHLSNQGIELVVTGADGHIYANFDWWVLGSLPWRKVEVSGFTLKRDGDCELVDDRLFVLDTGGAMWSTSIERAPLLPADPEWVRISPAEVAVTTFTVVAGSSPVRLLVTTAAGHVWDVTISEGESPRWMPLGFPAAGTVPPGVRVACATTHPDRLDIFVVAGTAPYTATWTESGWGGWVPAGPNPPDFRAASRTPLLVHRVNRQLELYVEKVNGDLVRTWWS